MTLFRIFFTFCAVIALSGCASRFEPETDDFGGWHLPFAAVEVTQLLKGSYGSKKFAFQIALSLEEERLSLIGIDAVGRRAFTVKWDKNGLHSEKASWLPDALKAEHILDDLMLAYWPIEALNRPSDRIVEGQYKRQVTRNGVAWVTITWFNKGTGLTEGDRWQGRAVIENHHRSYRIEVQSQRIEGAS